VLSEFAGENVYLPTSVGVSVVKLCGWDFHVFPFTRDIDSLNLQLRNYQPSNKSIALLHQDIVGSMYGSFLVEKGLDPGVLESKFSYTFVGHFHDQKQVSSSVWSVGSPLMLSFGEQDQTKGWLFLDTDEGVVKQLTNCVSPRFRTVNIESDDTLSTITDEEASKDFFQFVVTGTSIPDLSRFRWKRVKVQATSDKRKRTSISFSDSPVELLTKYVKARNVNLDTDMLVQIGLKYLER
jgi:DNA repair exonuclease SbcCD nuclease subunit